MAEIADRTGREIIILQGPGRWLGLMFLNLLDSFDGLAYNYRRKIAIAGNIIILPAH